MLTVGAEIVLDVDKPVAGGRMLARHDGQVVLVRGAIPGERVRIRIDEVGRDVAYGTTVDVLQPSTDRRPVLYDPACGGLAFAHIAYPRQLALKAAIIVDALARIGRLTLDAPPAIVPSPERGFRLRARLHVRGREVGFYREGSRHLCDATASGQFSGAAAELLGRLREWLRTLGPARAREIQLAEDLPAARRVLHVRCDTPVDEMPEPRLTALAGVQGITLSVASAPQPRQALGEPWVSDPISACAPARLSGADWPIRRHAASFFQSNRAVLPALVTAVLDAAGRGVVVDLYAGVGLFALALAAAGSERVEAVESDWWSGQDLAANARSFGHQVSVTLTTVEDYLRARAGPAVETAVVDPPRTGLSKAAVAGLLALRPARVVYVSCDVATFARDARRLVDGGYRLEHVQGFDMFPNTAQVELVGVFRRGGGS